jgi:NADPH-dependent curcumin reductase CurA
MTPSTFKRIVLAERPKGDIIPDVTFKQLDVPFDAVKPGQKEALVKVHYLSLGACRR